MGYKCIDCGSLHDRKTEMTKHTRRIHGREPLYKQGIEKYLFEVTFEMYFDNDFVGDETI